MLGVLADFCAELRAGGLPVAVGDEIAAAQALGAIDLGARGQVRAALAATLLKSVAHEPVFATAFDLYFSARSPTGGPAAEILGTASLPGSIEEGEAIGERVRLDPAALRQLVTEALRSGDPRLLERLARLAVAHFADIDPFRPVGVSYYLFKTLRALDLDAARAALAAAGEPGALGGDPAELDLRLQGLGGLGSRLAAEEYAARAAELRRLVEEEIRRQLVAERGIAAVARSLRRPLLEEVDFMHASREELAQMRRALYPLARVLATRLNRKRRLRRQGPLDFRATIRRSLSTGGVPLEPRFHVRHPGKPDVVVIADVSGSVASFARFTLYLVYALATQFSKVRTFVFVDDIDEVTGIFQRARTIDEAIERIDAEAHVSHLEGHSDYGRVLGVFAERHAAELTHRTSVLVLGDARNNYHRAEAGALAAIAAHARHTYWLNPEPRAYWGSGDSIIDQYAPLCDEVFECRNLRQLEDFVDKLD